MTKPKSKFYSQATYQMQRNHAPVDVLYEMQPDFDISKEEVDEYVKTLTRSKAISGALTANSDEKKFIFNTIDQKFTETYPEVVIYQRGENTEFYEYINGVYKQIGDTEIYNRMDNVFVQYSLFEERTSSRKVKDAIARLASLLSRTDKRHFSDKEKQPYFLNLMNGLFDMDSFTLMEHSRDYFTTVQLPYRYNPQSVCENFENFINVITQNNDATKSMIQDMFGYCLLNGNPKHKVFYLYGSTARNGKSSLAKILCGLLGENNYSNLSLEQISKRDSLISLIDKQINFSDEVDGRFIESSMLTQLSAEGTANLNPKYKKQFDSKIFAKFIIACNDLPRFQSAQGMKHRMITIPFHYQIPEEKRIDRIDIKLLLNEGSGILNWAIEGSKKLKDRGSFLISEDSKEESHENTLASFPVVAYLEENYHFSETCTETISTEEMYGTEERIAGETERTGYRAYCHRVNVRLCSFNTFSKEIARFGREKIFVKQIRIGDKRGYVGLIEKNTTNINF